jgi:hypothetical protein
MPDAGKLDEKGFRRIVESGPCAAKQARPTALRQDAEDQARVSDWAKSHFPRVDAVEILGAALCRADLLVEIEGTVSLGS